MRQRRSITQNVRKRERDQDRLRRKALGPDGKLKPGYRFVAGGASSVSEAVTCPPRGESQAKSRRREPSKPLKCIEVGCPKPEADRCTSCKYGFCAAHYEAHLNSPRLCSSRDGRVYDPSTNTFHPRIRIQR